MAIVKPGGFIEIQSDQFSEGTTVEVIVSVKESEPKVKKQEGLAHFIGINKEHGSFSNVADVDEYIRQERDSWDS